LHEPEAGATLRLCRSKSLRWLLGAGGVGSPCRHGLDLCGVVARSLGMVLSCGVASATVTLPPSSRISASGRRPARRAAWRSEHWRLLRQGVCCGPSSGFLLVAVDGGFLRGGRSADAALPDRAGATETASVPSGGFSASGICRAALGREARKFAVLRNLGAEADASSLSDGNGLLYERCSGCPQAAAGLLLCPWARRKARARWQLNEASRWPLRRRERWHSGRADSWPRRPGSRRGRRGPAPFRRLRAGRSRRRRQRCRRPRRTTGTWS